MNLCPPGLSQPDHGVAQRGRGVVTARSSEEVLFGMGGQDQPAGHSASRASTRLALTSTYG